MFTSRPVDMSFEIGGALISTSIAAPAIAGECASGSFFVFGLGKCGARLFSEQNIDEFVDIFAAF